jgi:hypothetical protein
MADQIDIAELLCGGTNQEIETKKSEDIPLKPSDSPFYDPQNIDNPSDYTAEGIINFFDKRLNDLLDAAEKSKNEQVPIITAPQEGLPDSSDAHKLFDDLLKGNKPTVLLWCGNQNPDSQDASLLRCAKRNNAPCIYKNEAQSLCCPTRVSMMQKLAKPTILPKKGLRVEVVVIDEDGNTVVRGTCGKDKFKDSLGEFLHEIETLVRDKKWEQNWDKIPLRVIPKDLWHVKFTNQSAPAKDYLADSAEEAIKKAKQYEESVGSKLQPISAYQTPKRIRK